MDARAFSVQTLTVGRTNSRTEPPPDVFKPLPVRTCIAWFFYVPYLQYTVIRPAMDKKEKKT